MHMARPALDAPGSGAETGACNTGGVPMDLDRRVAALEAKLKKTRVIAEIALGLAAVTTAILFARLMSN
jgi:hypothetical protein